jgi:mRNA interferase MazF
MATSSDYRLGSIWLVCFDPSVGTEIRKIRPALIVSGSIFNYRRTKVTLLPFTTTPVNSEKIAAAVVEVPSSTENGLAMNSTLICIDPITFDKERFIRQLGQIEPHLLQEAQTILRRYLKV